MNFLCEDNKKKKKNTKFGNKKGNVIVIVTKADLLAWNLDPNLLSSSQNQPIEDARSFVTGKTLINPYLLNLFVDSVDQSRWRVIQLPAFYSQLRSRFSIMHGSYLFICPTSSSVESVHTRLSFFIHSIGLFRTFPFHAPPLSPPHSLPSRPLFLQLSVESRHSGAHFPKIPFLHRRAKRARLLGVSQLSQGAAIRGDRRVLRVHRIPRFSSHAQKPSFQFHNTCVYILAPRTVFLENRDRILELATHRAKLEEATCPTPAITSEFSIVDWNILGVCFALRYASEEGASPFSRDRHRHVLTLNKLVDVLHPDFACMQEVDKFSQFWRAQLVLSGYKFLYARNAPRKDGLCILYNDLYTCERSFNVEYNELMKESDKLAKELIGMQDVCYNEVFEPDEALKQRAKKVKSVEIPETLDCKEKSNVLCQNKSALIGIFRHKKSWLCDAR